MKNLIITTFLFAIITVGYPGQSQSNNFDLDNSRTFDSGNFVFNNISVNMENNGMLVSYHITGNSGMEWPLGSDLFIDFSSGIWFAGIQNGEIRTAVAEYGSEFVPGTYASDPEEDISRIYYLSEWDIENPFSSADVINWPWTEGAPWIDNNNDGIYNVNDGDLPEMMGDFMIWYVMNDGDADGHANVFGTLPLNLEISVMQWGYTDSDMDDMVFTKLIVVNRGENTIEDLYFSIWDDPDLGYAGDDFVGCDTLLSLGYCYNDGPDNDYGGQAPSIGRVLLQGPMAASPGDSAYAFGSWHTGFRNLPMTSFVKYIYGDPTYHDPYNYTEAYYYMSGYLADGSPIIDSSTGLPSHFVYPCDPNENTDGSDNCWVDSDDHPSGDRRFLQSSGPFTMAAYYKQEIIFATVIGQGNDALDSITELKYGAQTAWIAYESNFTDTSLVDTDHFVLSDPTIVDDNLNHDGFWNNGETVLIDVSFYNSTLSPMTEIVSLFTTNSNVYIGDNQAFTITLDPGEEITMSELGWTPFLTLDENYDLTSVQITFSLQNETETGYEIISIPVILFGFTPEIVWIDQIEGNSDQDVGYIVVDPESLINHTYEVFFAEYDSVFNFINLTEEDTRFLPLRDTVSVMGINLIDITTGEMLITDMPLPNEIGFNVPVTHGFKLYLNELEQGIHGIWQTANANGPIAGIDEDVNENILWINFLSAPDYPTEQAQGGWAFFTHGGGTPNSMDSFYERVFRGSNFSRALSNEFEMRFTPDALINGLGYRRFEDENIIGNVPFELWNLGTNAEDTGDDYRMIPAILNGAGLGQADDDIEAYDFWGDDESSGGSDDPASDWIYWGNPDDTSPGQSGYNAFFTPGIGNQPAGGWTEVMARIRLMNWNRYLGGGGFPATLDSLSAESAMPEVGTVYRIITNKIPQSNDRYQFTMEVETVLGCTDPWAMNYDPEATEDDGSCEYFPTGDLNQDNLVNVIDVIRVVNIIFGVEVSDWELWAADVNGDGVIDVLDIVWLVNCIMADCWM